MKYSVILALTIAIIAGLYYYTAIGENNDTIDDRLSKVDAEALSAQSERDISETSEGDLALPELFKKVENSVVQITVRSDSLRFGREGVGSGFVYDQNGHVITNNHVIEGTDRIDVTFLDGTIYRATVAGTDPYSDLAVIRVNVPKDKLFPLPLADSSKLEIGQRVVAIGNPFGLSGSMTAGIISQLGRLLPLQDTRFSIPDVIQTDAAINPGNSGGPLLNLKGEVIGVNSAIRSATGEFSGIGFAIPSNTVKRIVPALIKEGVYKHPWLGVSGIDVTPEVADALGLNEARGFLVMDVIANSPADRYGIKGGDKQVTIDGRQVRIGGDVIIGIDDITVRKIDDVLVYLERKTSVGDEIQLTIIRDGRTMKFSVVLADRPSPFESP